MTPIDSTVSLRPATADDLDFLLDLRKTTMTAHMRNSGVDVTDETSLQKVLFLYEIADIIEQGERRIGLLKLKKQEKLWWLHQIQLLPEFQGQGVGGALLSEIVDSARKSGVEVRLHVLKANPARHFYERHGFVISDEAEHAYEMQLRIDNSFNGAANVASSLIEDSKDKSGS